ncbi:MULTISPECIES: LytR C-terminal domain-containing protein [Arthrobacter]|uniref:LytR family transcriptional regulator n=1 Tax=Arthrobacter oryzae TaxID=409290 RepID=A0A3N0BMI5_9MICC|nr:MULTISPECIES: LytR C-terminal domain-containing protein [Arthrobacter]QYF88605.1 LytR C-terminal domain-containing protein [Arthrobacter sp. PAMC25284]RNL49966.1 LytR family transcriptional regulator [Arthrobacter oryzae]
MARGPGEPPALNGHRVVTGADLRATFVEQDDALENPVRFRRRILHGAVLVALAGLVIAGIVVALAIINGQLTVPTPERSKEASSLCPAETHEYLPPESVTVNVYNSTSRPGLARGVADEFAARKFVVGAIANKSTGFRGVALVVSGAAGQSAALSVQRQVPGSDYFQDGRADATVDVILTDDFKELAKPEQVDQAPGRLSCPREDRRLVDEFSWPVTPAAASPAK